jgi:hypothetical protein
MTPGGWILLGCSLGFVISLVGWCYYRVLTAAPREIPQPTKDFHSA